ncbi:MAG: biotin/lipoyl-containing protein, partial [Brachybacterium sp.]|nr:biotin/lipoyl-containing protein [Brachybacterium sp.]
MAKIPLTMPKMSMTMEEGTVVEWNVAAGDTVAKGDVVAVVMTDKVDMEVESAAAGTVAELLVAEGDTLAVGAPMAMIDSEEDDLLGDLFGGGADDEGASTEGGKADRSEVSDHGEGSDPAGAPEHADTSENSATTDASESPGPRGEMPPAVPLARKLARDHGLDLRDITPTGPHGTVRVKDVKQEID